tara:strand:- start:1419 stop:1643 length:225 start_codon:yes stop_codon:yes gene_type:complete
MNYEKCLFEKMNTVQKILFLSVGVLLTPVWFPFWIIQQLKQDRLERAYLKKLNDENVIDQIFEKIRKDLENENC